MNYRRPGTLAEAFVDLKDLPGTAVPYAGGTDILPRWNRGLIDRADAVVDLKGIGELQGISRTDDDILIGPCTLLSELEQDPVIRTSAPVLAYAAGRVACPQIRNRATVGGNLCNASPAADTALPLILLDAVFELGGPGSKGPTTREVPAAEFFKGPGATCLAPGELLTGIRFKALPEGTYAAWDKFGTRPAMEIAVASVGVLLELEGGKVARARVGYGSVAPVPLRGRNAEEALAGNPLTPEVIEGAETAAREEIAPISDVRASASYRRDMVGVLLRRMLEGAKDR